MKIKGKKFSIFVGTAMAVIVTVTLLLGGCPATDSATDPGNNGNTTATYPGAPNITSLTPEDGQVTVAWTAPSDNGGAAITVYFIYYSETQGSGKSGTKVDAGIVTEFDVSGLTNGTTYYFVVTATNSAGEGEASREVSAIPSATASVPGVPTGLTLTPGDGQVTVAWTAPTNNGGAPITGYYIYYSENQGSGTGGIKVDAGNVTNFAVSGLINGKTYYFVVTAANSVGEGVVSEEQNAVPATVPDAPIGVTLTPGVQQVKVAWTAPASNGGAPISGYHIYYSETQGSGTNGIKVDAGDVTEFVVSGLINGTTYFFVVTAVNSVGESTVSDEQSTAPAATVPGAPTIVSLTPGDGQVTVEWTAPPDDGGVPITGYSIYYSETQGTGTSGTKVDTGNVTEYIVSGLINGTEYYFVVTASNTVGEGAVSNEASTIPSATATVPDAPTDVRLTSGNGQVTVTWKEPVNNGGAPITGYSIYYSETQGSGTSGTKVDAGNIPEFVVSSLSNGTTYYFTVTAVNSEGESAVSDEQSAIPATIPDAPTGISANSTGNGVITVSWTVPADNGGASIIKYTVYWGSSAGFEREATNSRDTTDGTATEMAIRSLTGGTDYFFVVTASNTTGESPVSEEVSAMALTVPGAPTDVTARVSGVGVITVSWKPPLSDGGLVITDYWISWGTTAGNRPTSANTAGGSATEKTIRRLTPKALYYFTVRAVNAMGKGVYSDEFSVMAATVPDPPTGISAVDNGKRGIIVSWTLPADNGGADITEYRVYWGTSSSFARNSTNSQHIADGSASELTIQNLNFGTPYYFVVTAANAAGESSNSEETSATMAVDVPDSPTDVNAMGTGNGEITVSWTASGNNGGSEITEYRVYWGSVSGFTPDTTNSEVLVLPVTPLELIIQNLNVNTNYFFVVTARNLNGESAFSTEVSTTGYALPDPPVDVSAIVTGVGKITVSWSLPTNDGGADITQFTVYWDTSSNFDINSAMGSKIINDVGITEILIDGLTIDTPYYFVITSTSVRGEGPVSEEISATPIAQVSSLISTLTLTIDEKDYPVTFSSSITSVDIDAMATMATVKAITLEAGASGLEVNDELTINKGMTTIPITAGDGSTIEHILYFRNPQITISATQLEIVDGTKSDGTKKLPSQFMVFDIETTATVSSQYNVEFLLVKNDSTAPTTLEEFRKTVSLHSDKANIKLPADIDVRMAYKSALFPTEKTSLYLAYDSEGNYPLDTNTDYTLYSVQPQSTDTEPVSLGTFKTGAPVDMNGATVSDFIETPGTANFGGKHFIARDQLIVLVGRIGTNLTSTQFKQPTERGGALINNGQIILVNTFWFMDKESPSNPAWYALAFNPPDGFYDGTTQETLIFLMGFAKFYYTVNLID